MTYSRRGETSNYAVIFGFAAFFVLFVLALWMSIQRYREPAKSVITVGVNTPFPPFTSRMGDKIVGFDIDLAERVAKSAGRRLIVKDFNEFDALLPLLQTGQLQMVVSAVTAREDRKEVADFSEPYFSASQAVLSLKGAGHRLQNPRDFAGFRVGYQKGTTSQFWAEKNLKNIGVGKIIPFDDVSFGLRLLAMKSVEAVIIDEPAARIFAKENRNLEILVVMETGENYAIAVKKGDPLNLLLTANKVIKELRKSGEYDRLMTKWFGGEKK